MINLLDLIRQGIFLTFVSVLYLFFGWQIVVLAIAVGIGFVFPKFVVTSAAVFGLVLHAIGLGVNYLLYGAETAFILEKSSLLMGGLPTILFPVLSVVLPASVYALAAFFSIHLTDFIKTYKP